MIDTDKYEGHTPEAWSVDEVDPCRVIDVQECTIARTDFIDLEEERSWQLVNAQLIADAPLLLAEVKRLRMIVARLEDARIENVGIHERPKLFIAVHEIYAQRLQDIYYERREEE